MNTTVEGERSLDPVPTDAEPALASPTLSINERAEPTFDNATAQGDDPDMDGHCSQDQAREPTEVLQRDGFKIEPMTFQVTREPLNLDAFVVQPDGLAASGLICDQKPRSL